MISRPSKLDETAQVSLRLRRDIDKYTHRYQANPGRIQISLIDTAAVVIAERNTPDLGPITKSTASLSMPDTAQGLRSNRYQKNP